MAKPALTDEMTSRWIAEMLRQQPPAIGAGSEAAYEVAAMTATPTSTGMILRLRTATGQTVDFSLNAVVAKAAIEAVKMCGSAGGWLDGEQEIIVQSPQGSRRWRPEA